MLTQKTNQANVTGRNKATKLIGTGKQRDYVSYDLQGKGTTTNLINQKGDILCRHPQSSGTEKQQIRIVSHMRHIAKELAAGAKPERVKKLNDLLDTYHARLQKLQAIVAKRHNVAIK